MIEYRLARKPPDTAPGMTRAAFETLVDWFGEIFTKREALLAFEEDEVDPLEFENLVDKGYIERVRT